MDKEAILTELGSQIRSIRLSKTLTQDDVAFRAGLARSYYGGVERGVRNVAAINLVNIARALEVAVGDLFIGIA